jgi:alkaline phosphatase D
VRPPTTPGSIETTNLPEPAPAPFSLGVASGDPVPDGVVLWTRVAPPPSPSVDVEWEVATDDAFSAVVRRGMTTATGETAHCVHVDVQGLEPDRWYWYRFRVGSSISPTGRTRTTPAADATPARLRLAHASCQNYQGGLFAAQRHLADEDIDLVVFLGDAIYESGPDAGGVRQHDGPPPSDLGGYRARWALYRSDPDLQAAHAAVPWVMTRDDHEVVNGDSTATPERRRAAALRAMWEHLPTRAAPPQGGRVTLYRSLQWGSLATIWMLDTRQDRTPQPCEHDASIGNPCPGEDRRTMLGPEQQQWLAAGLRESTAAWNVIGQQVMLAPLDLVPGRGTAYNLDQWDGYGRARRRLLALLAATTNPVVLTGDLHAAVVSDLRVDQQGEVVENGAAVGVELVAPGLSSHAPAALRLAAPLVRAANAHVLHLDPSVNGYVRSTIDAGGWLAEQRIVSRVDRRTATVATGPRFAIEPGARKATAV